MTAPDPYDELDPTKVRDEHASEHRAPADDRFAEPTGYVGRDEFPVYQPKQHPLSPQQGSSHPAPTRTPLAGAPHSVRRYAVILVTLLVVLVVTQGTSFIATGAWSPELALGIGLPALIGLAVILVLTLLRGRR